LLGLGVRTRSAGKNENGNEQIKMTIKFWNSTRVAIAGVVALIVAAGLGVSIWSFSLVDYLASGKQEKSFVVDCDFAKFRQIMVRKNATAAIIGRSGMTLLDEKIQDVQLDTSGDDRPLLNAILGRSKSDLTAIKQITVKLDDPAIDADKLVLRQQATIQPDLMNVVTKSKEPSGNLESYETTLEAQPSGDRTEVKLMVALSVRVKLPKMFTSRADTQVQRSALDAVTEQERSITAFIAQYADERLILPELGKE